MPKKSPAPRPSWPRAADPRGWLVATARCALVVGPDDRDRSFAGFALQELGFGGHRADVDRLGKKMLVLRGSRDLLRRVGAHEAVAEAYLALGDEPAAFAVMDALLPSATKLAKKGDARFVTEAVARFHAEGADALERARRAARRGDVTTATGLLRGIEKARGKVPWDRLLYVYAAARDAGGVRRAFEHLRRDDRDSVVVPHLLAAGMRSEALAILKREVAAAMRALEPREWNVHHPASTIEGAVVLACDVDRAFAESALDAALARFAGGELDARGFASAAAYASLARAAYPLRGREAAVALLDKALAVAGSGRQIVLPEVAEAYAAMGDYDTAVAIAAKVAKRRRTETLAAVQHRAARWKDLRATLATITAPGTAARIGWSICRALLHLA